MSVVRIYENKYVVVHSSRFLRHKSAISYGPKIFRDVFEARLVNQFNSLRARRYAVKSGLLLEEGQNHSDIFSPTNPIRYTNTTSESPTLAPRIKAARSNVERLLLPPAFDV